MDVSHSIRERTIAENSLVILLQGLHGQVTTIDLRDESTARGSVINVDAFMNIRLEKVLYRDRRGRVSSMDDLFITGRNVQTNPSRPSPVVLSHQNLPTYLFRRVFDCFCL
uniref:LSM10, U7 small nuclear RNA associated n=1 Tax=Cyprinus carpio TaxID=7962 RepID=A0A8C1YFV8_CYPCA